ncbi:Putative AC transposase [Dendrobium catenatum]|uniref:AC transposase n=1 Tax=Dendrobium catenatum TaxID=906689 RepID=A0A2I0W5N6_9ASPA|nr:Putative AC transposase [Dendrobium catenatum]
MKEKIDKYWGECNLLVAFEAIMNTRMIFLIIGFAYPMIYGDKSMHNISYVRTLLFELYEEYVTCFEEEAKVVGDTFRLGKESSIGASRSSRMAQEGGSNKYSGWHDFLACVSKKTNKKPSKSYLEKYLKDGLDICSHGRTFDVIVWWKSNQMKYHILFRLTIDILSISISTVASDLHS